MRAALAAVVGLALVVAAAPVPKDSPWVTLRGRVLWPKGECIPESKLVAVNIDKQACRAGTLRSEELLVQAKTRGVANVVVWLRPDTDDRKATFPTARIHPDLRKPKPVTHVVMMPKCQFSPRVFAARAGDTVEVRNDAAIAHSVQFATPADVKFNVLLKPDSKYDFDVPLLANRTPHVLSDAIHPWMRGYARVFDHPYFAVTDSDGHFEMKRVPKGNWRIVYWHERGFHEGRAGALGFPLRVNGTNLTQGVNTVELELPPSK